MPIPRHVHIELKCLVDRSRANVKPPGVSPSPAVVAAVQSQWKSLTQTEMLKRISFSIYVTTFENTRNHARVGVAHATHTRD
jgi:hypothetical protein